MKWRAPPLVAATIASVFPASAMTFSPYLVADKYSRIDASGIIEAGDLKRLNAAIQSAPSGRLLLAVKLDSPGGQIFEAEKMAEAINRSGIAAVVASGGRCASACFLMFAAAKMKFAAPDALIGVHSVSSGPGEESLSALGFTTLMARDLAAYNVPEEIIGRLVETEPPKISWLTGAELAAMGVSFIDAHRLEGVRQVPETPPLQRVTAMPLASIPPSASPGETKTAPQVIRPLSPSDFANIVNGKLMGTIIQFKGVEPLLRRTMGARMFNLSLHRVKEGLDHPFEITGDFAVAKTCVPHSCGFNETGWAFDHLGHAWASWTDDGNITFYGDPPREVRSALQGPDFSNYRKRGSIDAILSPIPSDQSNTRVSK